MKRAQVGEHEVKRCLRGQQDEVLSIASLVSPAPKLRKLGSRGQLGASPTSVGTTSEVGSDDMPSLQLAGPRDCLGCLRNSETGRAWPDPDIPIEWTVESNRGAWCKDCHNVWRNVVKAGMSLTVYELHLSSNPSHRLKHWQYLAAYIMLRSEGILRLSKELLDARRTSISLFCDLLGVPFGPFVVVPRPLSPGSDTLLCMYQDTAEGPISLRCLQPVSMSKSIENVMHVPARGVQPLIPIMRVDCGHDKRWLQHLPANEETDHPGSVDTAGAASSSSKVIAELEEGMRLPYGAEGEAEPHWLEEMGSGLTKTEVHAWRKANQAFLATLATLAHLLGLDVQTEGWAKPVTKLLKSHMLKLGRIRNELIIVPYKRYLDEVDNMTRATVSAQTFVREVGVYFRKYRNLGAVHQAGKDMWDWIGTLSKAPQMSLAVHEIVFKARVHSFFASRGSVGEAVECIVGSEGAALLERLETANKQDSAACVEFVDVILLDGFRVMCESFGDQPESKDVCPELARFHGRLATPETENLIDTISSIMVLLEATAPSTPANAVRKASEYLDSRAAKSYKSAMMASVLGQSLWAEAAGACATGALDEHSEELFLRGASAFEKELMPKSGDNVEWTNVDLCEVRRGQVCDLLQEALRDVFEAFQQWSQSGVEASMTLIRAFFERFAACLRMLDHCEWAVLIKAVASVESLVSFASKADDCSAEVVPHGAPFSVEAELFLTKSATLNFQRTPLLDVLCRVNEARDRMDKISEIHSELQCVFDDLVHGCAPTVIMHSKVRANLLAEMSSICSIVRMPMSSTEALVMDFQENTERSTIALACKIMDLRKAERKLNLSPIKLKTEEAGHPVVDWGTEELKHFTDTLLHGLPVGNIIVHNYVKGVYKVLEADWVDAVRPSLRLLEAAELVTCDIVSAKGVVDSILGCDSTATCSKLIGERMQSGGSLANICRQLLVTKLCNALVSMTAVLDEGDTDVLNFTWMTKVGVDKTAWTAERRGMKVVALQYVALLTKTTQILMLVAHLSTKYEVDKQPCTTMTSEGSIANFAVDTALLMATDELKSTEKYIGDECEVGGNTFALLAKKLHSFLQTWRARFFDLLAVGLSAKLLHVSQTTHSMSPNWKYFITDTKYTRSLASKHLLTDAAKVTLAAQTNAHHDFVVSISEAFAKWDIPPPCENIHMKKDFLHSADALSFAQDTVMVVAAVSTIEEMKGRSQVAAASALLQREGSKSLPDTLRKELFNIRMKK